MLWAACFYPRSFELTSGLKGSYGRPRRISTIRSEDLPSQSFGILPPSGFLQEPHRSEIWEVSLTSAHLELISFMIFRRMRTSSFWECNVFRGSIKLDEIYHLKVNVIGGKIFDIQVFHNLEGKGIIGKKTISPFHHLTFFYGFDVKRYYLHIERGDP